MNGMSLEPDTVPIPRSLLLDSQQNGDQHPGADPSAGASLAKPARAGKPLPLNIKELERRCMGQLDFAQRLLASFEARFPNEWAEIAECLAAENVDRLGQVVHQLKGTTANVCAHAMNSVLRQMEDSVKCRQLDRARQLLGDLQAEWEQFQVFKKTIEMKS